MSDLERLETLGAGMLAQLTPGKRAALAGRIARDLRRSQIRRIRAQSNPDGTPYAPRRPQAARSRHRHIKRGAMFRKLATHGYIRARGTPDEASVAFVRRVARIALVHQEGLTDRVRPGGPLADYPARRLLGFGAADIALVEDAILGHLAHGLHA